jgi:sugar/nucleoside kinase (ribokinase family)
MLAKLILDSLAERGVDTSYIIQSNTLQTGISVATCKGNDRTMVTYPGAMEALSEADISDGMLASAKHLHVSSIFLQPKLVPGIVQLFSRAKQLGLTTSLDPQFDPAEQWALDLPQLLPLVDVFLPNRSELLGFSQKTDLIDAIAQLKPFARMLVVKDGEQGAWLEHGNNLIFQTAYFNKQVVDAIGAGDSFDAGFIHHFLQQKKPADCLAFAALMGALNTTGAGGTQAFSGGLQAIRQRAKLLLGEDFEP